MALKTFNPKTPGLRGMANADYSDVTRSTPEKSLTRGKLSTGGRNNQGRITSRFRGGGVKRALRCIDFKRDKDGIPAVIAEIEYDPNRSARIALLNYADGEKRYMLLPVGLKQGDTVLSGPKAEFKPGNAMELGLIPEGVTVHNIEMTPGRGAALVRSAGQTAEIRSREGDYVQVKLPSGEVRLIHARCKATVGQVGNIEHSSIKYGKAGKKRYLGLRPHNRGVAMNPIDHPMGGGEGRSSGGHPCSPWGQYAKGMKTRNPRNVSTRFILERRKK